MWYKVPSAELTEREYQESSVLKSTEEQREQGRGSFDEKFV